MRKDDAPLPLSAVTGKVILVPANGKKRVRDVTLVDKVNGIAEYVLDEDEIKMYGLFQCELVLVYSNKQAMSAHKFGFEVTQSLMDQDIAPVGEYYIDDFETLKAKVIEIYDSTIQTLDDLKKKFEDLENIETKQGAQEKVDAVQANLDNHLNDKKNPHGVTKAQIGLSAVTNDVQAKKTDFDKHTSDTSNPHKVTAAQLGLDKVENIQQAAKTDFDTHVNDEDIHVNKSFKDKVGELLQQFTSDFKAKMEELLQQFTAHSYNQIRHISDAERKKWNGSVTYANIMLKNGATAGTRTPMYAKWGAFLILRGHVRTEPEIMFGSIPAELVPFGGAVKSVPLSGTGGTANLIIYDNGDLKIKYPDPADSSKMGGGYYLDVVVGFQKGDTT